MDTYLHYDINDSLSVVDAESGEFVFKIKDALCGDPANLGAVLQAYLTLGVLKRLGVIEKEGEDE